MNEQCSQIVYVKDGLRYSGRGPGGFSMHYRRQRCSRRATKDGLCWQHQSGYLAEQTMQRWHGKRRPGLGPAAGAVDRTGGMPSLLPGATPKALPEPQIREIGR